MAGTVVFNDEYVFSEQLPVYLRIDVRVELKWIGKRLSQVTVIDIRNLTNRKNSSYIKSDPVTGNLKTLKFGITPDILNRILFYFNGEVKNFMYHGSQYE